MLIMDSEISQAPRRKSRTKLSLRKLIKAALKRELTEDLKDVFDFSESVRKQSVAEVEQVLRKKKISTLVSELVLHRSSGTALIQQALACFLLRNAEIAPKLRKDVS